MTRTEQEVEKIILPIIEQLGYKLYDVEFVKESTDWFLRIYIEKDGHTIDLDDCEKVSNAVGDKLDEVDPITSAYNLEVSSCGLERHLREPKHYSWAVGKNISVKLYKAVNSNKQYDVPGCAPNCGSRTTKKFFNGFNFSNRFLISLSVI